MPKEIEILGEISEKEFLFLLIQKILDKPNGVRFIENILEDYSHENIPEDVKVELIEAITDIEDRKGMNEKTIVRFSKNFSKLNKNKAPKITKENLIINSEATITYLNQLYNIELNNYKKAILEKIKARNKMTKKEKEKDKERRKKQIKLSEKKKNVEIIV
jgi:hypothetical protein